MNLQDTFYVVGIISMTLYTILLIIIAVAAFYIWKKVNEIQKTFTEKVAPVKYAVSHPKKVAENLGAAAADTALEEVKKVIKPKSKRRKR